MTSKIIYKGDLRTEAVHLQSGTTIITDAPTDNQGKGEYFSPTDFVATALGSCMLTIMGIAARSYNFSIEGTEIEVTKIMGTEPRRITEIHLKFQFPDNNYSEKEKKILQYCADTCPVAKSLHPDLKQVIEYNYRKSE